MKTFRISGKCGDTVYALPTIEKLGGGVLYVPYDGPESPGFYNNMKLFLENIPYILEVRPYHHVGGYMGKMYGDQWDYDLDYVRLQPNRGRRFMVQQYFDAFGIKSPIPEKWLNVKPYSLGRPIVNVTSRHRQGCNYNWNNIPDDAFFVGTEEELKAFPRKIDYAFASDFLEVAEYVSGASAVWCSQSSVLTLAQALGVEYYCTFKPGKTNCRTYLPNEHAL